MNARFEKLSKDEKIEVLENALGLMSSNNGQSIEDVINKSLPERKVEEYINTALSNTNLPSLAHAWMDAVLIGVRRYMVDMSENDELPLDMNDLFK